MKDITMFSAHTVANFDNDYNNMVQFNDLLLDASHGIYEKYTKNETETIFKNQFDKILGGDFTKMNAQQRHQAWRKHGLEICTLMEDVLVDKNNNGGWDEANARFMDLVEEVNLAIDDKQQFYVEDNSLLQVSKFAGNHHDIRKTVSA